MIPDFVGTTAILGVMIPIFAMIITLGIVVTAMNRNYKIKQLEHEQKLKALELGYDVPVSPMRRKSNYPFAWPFVFIGFGIALILIYIIVQPYDATAIGFGLVSLFIGLALFASRYYGAKANGNNLETSNVMQAPHKSDAPKPQKSANVAKENADDYKPPSE